MNILEYPAAAAAYIIALTFVLGLVFGSFCNAWAWRIVHHESIARGRSHCPACGHTLAAKDLVPLFSWLFLKGKCRYCGAPVSKRYPFTELLLGIFFLSMLLRYGISWDFLRYCALGSLLLVMSLEDWDSMEIEDFLQVPAALLFLLRFEEAGFWKDALFGLFIAGGVLLVVLLMERLLRRDAMGGADIKLLAVFGLHFGPQRTLLLLILACVAGILGALLSKKGFGREFPFGPALAIAAWMTMLFGQSILQAYLSLF